MFNQEMQRRSWSEEQIFTLATLTRWRLKPEEELVVVQLLEHQKRKKPEVSKEKRKVSLIRAERRHMAS